MVIVEDLDIPQDENIDIRNPLRLKAYKDAGIKGGDWSTDEQRLQMFFDEIRGNDFHYRFTRTLRRLTKFMDASGQDYLIIIEDLHGKSPIGNDKSYSWEKGVTAIPKAQRISVPVNSESFKSEVTEMSGGDKFFETPFSRDLVMDALKAAPNYNEKNTIEQNLFGVSMKVQIYDTDITYGIHPSKFDVWCDYPAEELYEACKLGRINILGGGKDKDQDKLINALIGYNKTEREEIMNKVTAQQQREENLVTNRNKQSKQSS